MSPQRLPDWPERLAAYLDARRGARFEWGVNDCASFAAGAALAVTGCDLMAPLRGQWSSEDQARQVLQRLGGLGWAAVAMLGRPLRHAGLAPRGAVVLARMSGAPILGVQAGAHWCAPGARGLEFRPVREVRLAWGV